MQKNKCKLITLIITGVVVFGIYLSLVIINKTNIAYNDTVTLPVIGISMPYWLLLVIDSITVPGLSVLIMNDILDRISKKG